jgi:phosphoheptose isomerase/CTP:molybdopterin cytidylyltransferase MocA
MRALILCGGQGTRLRSIVGDRPKVLAPVLGRPFLEWVLLGLRSEGLEEVTLCTGYGHDAIARTIGDGRAVGMTVRYSQETSARGTAGAIRNALEGDIHDQVLVMNGDSYCHVRLAELERVHAARNSCVTLRAVPAQDRTRFGSLTVGSEGQVEALAEKTARTGPGLVNAGVYVLAPGVVARIPEAAPASLERDVLPGYVGRGMYAVVGDGPFVDIGTPESYLDAEATLAPEFAALAGAPASLRARLDSHLAESRSVQLLAATACAAAVVEAARMIAAGFGAGGKILLCGNGGSAADCQHFAAEFVSQLTKEFSRPGLPAIALTTDTSILTAYANDFGFEGVFERQVRALGRPGDVLVALSTSGNSENVRRAVRAAREIGLRTVGLLGEGGQLTAEVDCPIVVPSRNTQYVQESLLPIEHAICDLVERLLLAASRTW